MQLDLSRNSIQNVQGLDKCVQIKILNLSYNKLSSVVILQPLVEL